MDYIHKDTDVRIDDKMKKVLDKYVDDLKKSKRTIDVNNAYWDFYWDFQQVVNDKVYNR